jgi:hypothetical protein
MSDVADSSHFEEIFNDIVIPTISLPSARYNIPLDIIQILDPSDPKSSYIEFDPASKQNLFEYSNNHGNWEWLNPTTLKILTEGNFLISIALDIYLISDEDPGNASFKITHELDSVCSTIPFNYVGTGTGVSLAHLDSNSLIRIAYSVSTQCSITSNSNICICKV